MPPPPDRNPIEGFWGKPTSTLDWCEENYVENYYIAEFWNTVSNLMMIIPGLFGILHYSRNGFEPQYILSNFSLFFVGIGSWMFHMTLWFEMQLLDELPMIYGTCVFLYTLAHRRSQVNYVGKLYIWTLVFISMAVTVTYLAIKEPVFHQVLFGLLVLAVVLEAIDAMKEYPQIKPTLAISLMCYVIGFSLWNIDNICCSAIRTTRDHLPSAIKPITQLHAWWHILTGYGTYTHILFSSQLRALHLKRKCHLKHLFGVLPYHLQVDEKKTTA